MIVSELVRKAWHVNDGMNEVLLEHLTPEMLTVTTPDKNWSVAGYLAHLAASKKWWASHLNREHSELLPDLFHKTGETLTAERDLATIRDVFEQTSRVILETAEHAANKGALPYASIDLYLIHMLVHDAHHRGQMLLTLRTAGYALPEEDEFWGGWWPEQVL